MTDKTDKAARRLARARLVMVRRSPTPTDRLLLEVLAAANRILEGLADGGELEGLPSGTPVSVPIDDICALSRAVAKAEGGG